MTTRSNVEELRGLFLFEKLTDEQLAWIAERAEVRTFAAGAPVFREGEPADALWVLIEGGLRLTRIASGEEVTINETTHRGAYAGAVRAFAATASDVYLTSVYATTASRFLRLAAADFAELMRRWFPMAVHLLDGLYAGTRNTEATVRQREHLAKLGSLAANLARLVALQEAAVEQAAKEREPLTPLAESDREDAFIDRLEELGIPDGYQLAPVFTAAGFTPDWLDLLEAEVGAEALEGALRWLAYTLETEALMDEIEDASNRISSMVAAVKQYSYLDQAAHQKVDLHPGLDSTLIMLGHKLAGVEVRREYDRSLPPVPAYASELNQVWTNLIDNAVDAMEGRGVLRLRTARDGDYAMVEVSDTGPGVSESVRDRLFEPFVTTKPAGQGSGLGLDNARRIIERRHRGPPRVAGRPSTGPGRLPASRVRRSLGVEEPAQPGQRPCVDHVLGGQPAPLRGPHAVPHVVEVHGGVRVGVDGELHAVAAGAQDQLVVEVQPVGEATDLKRRAGPGGRLEHLVEVGVDRRALADQPGGRVADDVHVRVLAGPYQSPGHLLP